MDPVELAVLTNVESFGGQYPDTSFRGWDVRDKLVVFVFLWLNVCDGTLSRMGVCCNLDSVTVRIPMGSLSRCEWGHFLRQRSESS